MILLVIIILVIKMWIIVSSQQQQQAPPATNEKLYWNSLNEYPTRAKSTTNISNVCGSVDNSGNGDSSSFVTSLFVRHDYKKPYKVYVFFCLFFFILLKNRQRKKTLLVLNDIHIFIYSVCVCWKKMSL